MVLGGFIGGYAELIADDGHLSLGLTGSAGDFDAAALAAGARISGPDGFLREYGRFGYDGPDGAVGDAALRNLTMTSNFPWVGEIAAELWPQVTGHSLDGVILADPYVLAEVLRYTGPVHLAAYDQDVSYENSIAFLLRDQYVVGADDSEQRHDALAEAAVGTFDAILANGLPDPMSLSQAFGPLVSDRRLMFWSAHGDEQALLSRLGLDGAIPALDGADGWAVTVTNGAGNKIDSFLERRARYEASTDQTGDTTGTLRIELTNTAPSEGLPPYIIGGPLQLPDGTSRLYVSVYSASGWTASWSTGTGSTWTSATSRAGTCTPASSTSRRARP